MPWRLIGLAIIFVVFLTFIGFNLDNRCDVSFVFWEAQDIPVFLPIFTAFVLGLLCSIPFAVSIGRKRSKKKRSKGDSTPKPEDVSIGGPYDID
jgi:uncharacterized integral membrane protein